MLIAVVAVGVSKSSTLNEAISGINSQSVPQLDRAGQIDSNIGYMLSN
ncbi:hypothetical protein [Sphingomonas hankookensis]